MKDRGENDIISAIITIQHLQRGFYASSQGLQEIYSLITMYNKHGNCQILETRLGGRNESSTTLQGSQINRYSALGDFR